MGSYSMYSIWHLQLSIITLKFIPFIVHSKLLSISFHQGVEGLNGRVGVYLTVKKLSNYLPLQQKDVRLQVAPHSW